jgi:hypothetical protein
LRCEAVKPILAPQTPAKSGIIKVKHVKALTKEGSDPAGIRPFLRSLAMNVAFVQKYVLKKRVKQIKLNH